MTEETFAKLSEMSENIFSTMWNIVLKQMEYEMDNEYRQHGKVEFGKLNNKFQEFISAFIHSPQIKSSQNGSFMEFLTKELKNKAGELFDSYEKKAKEIKLKSAAEEKKFKIWPIIVSSLCIMPGIYFLLSYFEPDLNLNYLKAAICITSFFITTIGVIWEKRNRRRQYELQREFYLKQIAEEKQIFLTFVSETNKNILQAGKLTTGILSTALKNGMETAETFVSETKKNAFQASITAGIIGITVGVKAAKAGAKIAQGLKNTIFNHKKDK